MEISEMHVMFREMAQQMGMQTTRAILNEDIDICLNSAIIEKVREVLLQNIQPGVYPDKVIRQNTVIAPINAIRTLYRRGVITEDGIDTDEDADVSETNPYQVIINSKENQVMYYTGFKVSYDNKSLYDCRLIEAEDLGQTLRDFCNRAAPDAPIAVVFGDTNSITVDLYTGRTTNTWKEESTILKPILVQYLYIKEPASVHYDMIDSSKNINCDLPAYLHGEIVEKGVAKYLISIGATSGNRQQNNSNNQNN